MSNPTHYQTLGVLPTATLNDIKKAYRALAQKHHPDHNPGDNAAEIKFKEITAAYDVLKNIRTRLHYDNSLRPAMATAGTADFSPRARPTAPAARSYEPMSLWQSELLNIGIIGFLAFYAALLLVRSHFIPIHVVLGFGGLIALTFCFAREALYDLVGNWAYSLSAGKCNLFWLLVTLLTFNHAFNGEYQRVFAQAPNENAQLLLGLVRFMFFLWWGVFLGVWHWLFLCTFLLSVLLLYKLEHVTLAGWSILALQLIASGIFCFHPTLLHGFVIYYEPLFTIAPLTPVL